MMNSKERCLDFRDSEINQIDKKLTEIIPEYDEDILLRKLFINNLEEKITLFDRRKLENNTPFPYVYMPERIEVVVPPPVEERYSPQRVANLLANPELTHPWYSNYARVHAVEFFAGTIMSGERVAIDMAASERVYTGRWYGQGYEPTCTPWSLVNACAVGGVEMDPDYITYLLNQAIKEKGYPLACVSSSLKQSPVMTKRVRLISLGSGLDTLVIKRALDEDQPLMVSVITRLFYQQPNLGRHAICISGYQVTEEGYLNVQVIDSNNGIVWMSLEHLWPTITEAYILTKIVS